MKRNIISAIIGILIGLAVAIFQVMHWPVTVFGADLVDCTAYHRGTIGSHGDVMQTGYCAARPEDYGKNIFAYRAIKTESGYEMGELLYIMEIRDTGFGTDTKTGKSKIFKGRTAGSIEVGSQIDIYRPNLEECKEVMQETGGKVFVEIIEPK